MQYIISGKVVKGDGYGRKIGFPTVNLETKVKDLPADGVYAGLAILDNKEYRAGIVIGPHGKIEAHLLGYEGDAYRKEVTLEIKKFIRAYKKFDTEEELINQIKEDIKLC
jgi:riboflavin kinase/FMN adenylyltransferase